MPNQINPEEILARNPKIDKDQLEESRELNFRLREAGVKRKGYDLAPAFGGRRVSVQEDKDRPLRLLRPRQ